MSDGNEFQRSDAATRNVAYCFRRFLQRTDLSRFKVGSKYSCVFNDFCFIIDALQWSVRSKCVLLGHDV